MDFNSFLNPTLGANLSAPAASVKNVPNSGELDQDAIRLAQSIRQQEGHNFKASNPDAGGWSVGAYQWHGDNPEGAMQHFKNDATSFGLDPNDFSPENQNHVAYSKIKKLKDQGRQPDEIAAIWNGAHIVNGRYVANNPAYVQKVKNIYQQLKLTNPTIPPVASASNEETGVGTVEHDYPGKGIVDFAHGLVEPELKGLASGVRGVQAAYQELTGKDQDTVAKTLASPIWGQKTLAGSNTEENLGSAGNAALQGFGLKLAGAEPTILKPVSKATGLIGKLIPKSSAGKLITGLIADKVIKKSTGVDLIGALLKDLIP